MKKDSDTQLPEHKGKHQRCQDLLASKKRLNQNSELERSTAPYQADFIDGQVLPPTEEEFTSPSFIPEIIEPTPKDTPRSWLLPSQWRSIVTTFITLVLGVYIGLNQTVSTTLGLPITQSLQPTHELAQILDSHRSGISARLNDPNGISVHPELSFKHRQGGTCRLYRVQSTTQAFRGISCKTDDSWENVMLVPTTHIQQKSKQYKPASTFDGPVISQYLANYMQESPLGIREEKQQLNGS